MVNWFKRVFGAVTAQPTPLELKAKKLLEAAMEEEAARQAEAQQLIGVRGNFIAAQEMQEEPWAMFEIVGFADDGRIKVEFNWNEAFIKRLDSLGFTGETPEDSVQLFFYTSTMKPVSLDGDQAVQSDDLPTLAQNVNRVQR